MKTILIFLVSILTSFSYASGFDTKLETEFTQNGYQHVTVSSVTASELYSSAALKSATHFMNLSFILFRNTGWTKEQVLSHLKEIVRIYNSQSCQIFVRKAVIVEADPYLDITDVDWASIYTLPSLRGVDIKIASQFPTDLPRPAIALVGSVLYPVDAAFSAAAFKAGDNPSYVNSTWIPARVNEATYTKLLPTGYDPIAHELAHLLGNTGHNNLSEPNILHDDFSKINDKILPEQCDAFKQSGLVTQ